jgi:Tfp pilus assembly protein PilE
MFYSIINSFNNAFSKGFTTIEIIMNLSFILIIFLIIYIFYWHSINRKVAKLNRCKINLNTEGSIYTIYGKHKQTKLYKIKYDNTDDHKVSVDCVCPVGNMPNKFEIKAYNNRTQKTQSVDKYCNCDKFYNLNDKNALNYSGDDFLVSYYNDNKDIDAEYMSKPIFPDII